MKWVPKAVQKTMTTPLLTIEMDSSTNNIPRRLGGATSEMYKGAPSHERAGLVANDDDHIVEKFAYVSGMAYHHFQILVPSAVDVHRVSTLEWTGTWFSARSSRSHASASKISQLLIQYEKDHSFGCMHSYAVDVMFSAALISLFNVIATITRPLADVTHSEATADLSIFFRALDDLSWLFDSVKRVREHLATIQRKWYLSGLQSGQNAKRMQQSAQAGSRQKRSRTTNSASVVN